MVEPGDDLARLIVEAAERQGVGIEEGDVVVVTCKVVSKALGLLYRVDEVELSAEAVRIASRAGLDPRFVELVLRESDRILAAVPVLELARRGLLGFDKLAPSPEEAWKLLEEYPTLFLIERGGSIWSDAGLDSSNHPPGVYSAPPRDIDGAARAIRDGIMRLTGKRVAVVVCDTEAFLGGSLDLARGSYGIDPVDRCFACRDLYGKPKYGGVDLVAHELCAAAALVMKQTGQGVPVVVVRGLEYRPAEAGMRELLPASSPDQLAGIVAATVRHTVRVLGLRAVLRFVKLVARSLLGR